MSNQNSSSIWSRRLASRPSSTNMAASRRPVEWRHFVEVNSRNLGSSHVCWGSYDGFNFAGWRGSCVYHTHSHWPFSFVYSTVGIKQCVVVYVHNKQLKLVNDRWPPTSKFVIRCTLYHIHRLVCRLASGFYQIDLPANFATVSCATFCKW